MKLHSLGGADAPSDLAADLTALGSLPASVADTLWEALAPSLDTPLDPALEGHLDAYVARHRCDGDTLARVLKAARFLVRAAARRGLSTARFEEDLSALVGDAGGRLVTVLGAGYPIALRHLRRSFGAAAAARLAPKVTALAWHVATITASDEAEALDQRVGTLRVTLDDKGCTQVLTLHLTPSEAPSLLAFAEKLLESASTR
ncbi:MAG: hypothetical protein JNK72_17445 [Myxococcales bacterium]|nr:hypothetical protein [Myxococcales bacterium]